ncbi:MAG: lipid-A-disaccharide synthase [Deltaproteobacteria bacterium]|nr:lipid-A-disaccharide synthase [Deltaproteobacteria bacterium]
MTRIMIAAGESSGDLHGSNLVRSALSLDPDLEFYGLGGEKMKAAGVWLLFDLEHQGLAGLAEVITSLRSTLATLNTLKNSLKQERPSGLVLIDYPDFNLSLAKTARRLGIPVFYYISPQVWAWRRGRIKKIKRLVNQMVVVFPFEVAYYRQHGFDVSFVGHPLLDVMDIPRPKEEVKAELGFAAAEPLLGLLPGSRMSEIRQHLPLMLECASQVRNQVPGLSLAVAQADTIKTEELDPYLDACPIKVKVMRGQTHSLQNAADVILAASGTATLETALMLTPMVVIYRVRSLTLFLLKRLVKLEHFAMANLIAGERLVPELLQKQARPDRITAELVSLLKEPETRTKMIDGLKNVRKKLGEPGGSKRAAELLLATIEKGSV